MSIYQAALSAVEPRETFVERTLRALTTHGIPQARLAEAAGTTPTQLTRWAKGHQTPSLESMLRLIDALEQVLYG